MQSNAPAPQTENAAPASPQTFWGFWATTGFGFAVISASFIAQGLAAVIFVVTYLSANPGAGLTDATNQVNANMGTIASAALLLEVLVCLPMIWFFAGLRRGISAVDYLGLRRIKVKTLLLWLGIDFVFLLVTELIRYAFGLPQSQNDAGLYTTSRILPLFFIGIVVFAPAFEELLFRGFMLRGYSRSPIGPAAAVVVTAALWTSLHAGAGAYDLVVIFAGGLLFGSARLKTGSLWTTLVMHAFWNAIAFVTIALSLP
jgi:membrane protease YdiL (CAAX protease family)